MSSPLSFYFDSILFIYFFVLSSLENVVWGKFEKNFIILSVYERYKN